MVDIEGDSTVTGLTAVASMSMRINGGYFVPERDLQLPHAGRGSRHGCLHASRQGWPVSRRTVRRLLPMDTLKERSALEEQYRRGTARGHCGGNGR